jgi:hypothetical protein
MVSREEARAAGLKRYNGAPCRYGHSGERYTSDHGCVECVVNRAASRNALKVVRRQNMLKALQVSRPRSTAERAKGRQKTLPLPKLEQADVKPLLVALIDLPSNGCKYPYGDAGYYRFCGLSRMMSSNPYCQPHMALSYRPPDELRERKFLRSVKTAAGLATIPSSLAA